MNRILYFEVDVIGDILSDGAKPIYSDEKKALLGSFVLKRGETLACFVSATDKPYSLYFSSDQPFFFTPCEDQSTGKVESALISAYSISPLSVKVKAYKVGNNE